MQISHCIIPQNIIDKVEKLYICNDRNGSLPQEIKHFCKWVLYTDFNFGCKQFYFIFYFFLWNFYLAETWDDKPHLVVIF